jgi:hypothetical protein
LHKPALQVSPAAASRQRPSFLERLNKGWSKADENAFQLANNFQMEVMNDCWKKNARVGALARFL